MNKIGYIIKALPLSNDELYSNSVLNIFQSHTINQLTFFYVQQKQILALVVVDLNITWEARNTTMFSGYQPPLDISSSDTTMETIRTLLLSVG